MDLKLNWAIYAHTIIENKENIEISKPLQIASGNNYLFPKGYTMDNLLADAHKFKEKDGADKMIFYTGMSASVQKEVQYPLSYFNKAEDIFRKIAEENKEIVPYCSISCDRKDILYMADLRNNRSDHTHKIQAFFTICRDEITMDFKISYGSATESASDLDHLQEFYDVVKNAYTELVK